MYYMNREADAQYYYAIRPPMNFKCTDNFM